MLLSPLSFFLSLSLSRSLCIHTVCVCVCNQAPPSKSVDWTVDPVRTSVVKQQKKEIEKLFSTRPTKTTIGVLHWRIGRFPWLASAIDDPCTVVFFLRLSSLHLPPPPVFFFYFVWKRAGVFFFIKLISWLLLFVYLNGWVRFYK